MADEADDAERQAAELMVLQAIYSEPGEVEAASAQEWTVRLDERSLLRLHLPANYPSTEPPMPELLLGWPLADSSTAALVGELHGLYTAGEEAVHTWVEHLRAALPALRPPEPQPVPPPAAVTQRPPPPPSLHGRRLIWFHHIKSLEKRKSIVAWARAARLAGFCKPGFPGVLAAEGDEAALGDFVHRLRALRWQAMDVRFAESAATPPSDGSLPLPFRELCEGAMGEAAALCAAASLGDVFRSAVLKVGGSGGAVT